jgi:hypothetical protein
MHLAGSKFYVFLLLFRSKYDTCQLNNSLFMPSIQKASSLFAEKKILTLLLWKLFAEKKRERCKANHLLTNGAKR